MSFRARRKLQPAGVSPQDPRVSRDHLCTDPMPWYTASRCAPPHHCNGGLQASCRTTLYRDEKEIVERIIPERGSARPWYLETTIPVRAQIRRSASDTYHKIMQFSRDKLREKAFGQGHWLPILCTHYVDLTLVHFKPLELLQMSFQVHDSYEAAIAHVHGIRKTPFEQMSHPETLPPRDHRGR